MSQFVEPVEVIGELKNSLLFAMSKGSHELFHTNIWAWLVEKDHEFCKVFFDNLNPDEFLRVEREVGDRDLTIWVKRNDMEMAFVVENKFKAAPCELQLEKYELGLKKKEQFGAGLLVSLQLPPGSGTWNWRTITQKDLMDRIIEKTKKSSVFSEFERKLISEYVEMTKKLSDVLDGYSNALGQKWPANGDEGLLEAVKLGDIFKKMKAAELAQYIEDKDETRQWRETAKKHGLILSVQPDYSNKSALLDVRIEKHVLNAKGKDVEQFCVGVQIQGGQYRRCVCSHDIGKFKEAESLYRMFCKDGVWFGDGEFLHQETSMRNEFCQYESKDYRFAYQYVNLRQFKFGEIFERIKIEMQKVMTMLEGGMLSELI